VRRVRGEEWQQVDPESIDPELQGALHKMNPKQVALFCAWVVNGRNINAAARQIGFNESYARKLFSQDSAFKKARTYLEDIVLLEDQEWIDCLPRARQTMRSLLVAKDEKVRYPAAKDIVDRAEGKAVARVDMNIREHQPSLTDGEMQLALSLMQHAALGFAEAVADIRAHPAESEQWIAEQRLPRNAGS
jgi:hypothetical protein